MLEKTEILTAIIANLAKAAYYLSHVYALWLMLP